jgi:hypothetical protein
MNLVVDYGLTPENCAAKGFVWFKDDLYDPEAPHEANSEFEELMRKGWKLGEPGNKSTIQNGGVGLYKPLA